MKRLSRPILPRLRGTPHCEPLRLLNHAGRRTAPARSLAACLLLSGAIGLAQGESAAPADSAATSVGTASVYGYRGIWFTHGTRSDTDVKYSGGLGTYTSSHTPMAVYAPAVQRTFFTYGGTPSADRRQLQVMVGSFDHASGRLAKPVVVFDKPGVDDPHDNASLNLDAEGYVWVFASGRNTSRPGVIFRSQQPYSIAQFDRIATQTFTYPQPWIVPGKGWLMLFTKYTAGRELYWKTSADGRTWSEDRKLAGFAGHYQTSAIHDGRKIATFFNYHPRGDVDRRTNVYYAQSTDYGATWTTVDGQPLTLPLTTVDNPARVTDLESRGELMFTCDINFDARGNPILLYVVGRDARPGPHTAAREWTVCHWDGDAWRTHVVATSDHNYDMGSLYVEGDTWNVIAPTAPGPQPHGVGGDMVLWTSRDEGRHWTAQRTLTRDSRYNHSYARRPLNARDPFYVFWADGNPRQFSASHLYFSDSAGRHVRQMPATMNTDEVAFPMDR